MTIPTPQLANGLRSTALRGADALFTAVYERVVEPRLDTSVLLIQAPRAFGKSEIVALMSARLGIPREHVVDGKAADGAERLEVLAKNLRGKVVSSAGELRRVVVDDLDVLLGVNQAGDRVDSRSGLRTALEVLISEASSLDSRLRLVLTTTAAPSTITEPSFIISDALRKPPLELGALLDDEWRWALVAAVQGIIHGGHHARVHDRELADQVLELSGGHPALMVAGLEALTALFGDMASKELQLRSSDKAFVRLAVMQAMLYDGAAPVRRQLARMRESPDPVNAAVLATLRAQVEAPAKEWFRTSVEEGTVILDTGLARLVDPRLKGCFQIRSGVFRDVLRAELLASPASESRETEAETPAALRGLQLAAFSALPGSRRGEVMFQPAGGLPTTVILTPNSWLIANELLDAGGGVVGVDQIKRVLERKNGAELSRQGVMTAIQRFIHELSETGERLVQNVHGAGYRIAVDQYDIKDLRSPYAAESPEQRST